MHTLTKLLHALILCLLGSAAGGFAQYAQAHGGAHHHADAGAPAVPEQASGRRELEPSAERNESAPSSISTQPRCPSGPDFGCHCASAIHLSLSKPVAPAPRALFEPLPVGTSAPVPAVRRDPQKPALLVSTAPRPPPLLAILQR